MSRPPGDHVGPAETTRPDARDEATRPSGREDAVTAALGAATVLAVYVDGWAHVHVGGLDTFFTPWHAALYGTFTLLAGWVAVTAFRHRDRETRLLRSVPRGYGMALIGAVIFAVAGVGDLLWHQLFGVETAVDALVSPTHLLLLTGGLLLALCPARSVWPANPARRSVPLPWVLVVSIAAATALVQFFLSYVSVFAADAAATAVQLIPEGLPGHAALEAPVSLGLAGYVVTSLLMVLPLVRADRAGTLPVGAVTALTAAVAVPATLLSARLDFVVAAATVLSAALLELARQYLPKLPTLALIAAVPAVAWYTQIMVLAVTGALAWPVTLTLGAVALGALTGVGATLLTAAQRSHLP